jgi:hypothetical protein
VQQDTCTEVVLRPSLSQIPSESESFVLEPRLGAQNYEEGNGVPLVNMMRANTGMQSGLMLCIESSELTTTQFGDDLETKSVYFYRLCVYLEPVEASSPCPQPRALREGSQVSKSEFGDDAFLAQSQQSSPPWRDRSHHSSHDPRKRQRTASISSEGTTFKGEVLKVSKRTKPQHTRNASGCSMDTAMRDAIFCADMIR